MFLSLQCVGILVAVTCIWEEQGKKDGLGSKLSVGGHVVLSFLGTMMADHHGGKSDGEQCGSPQGSQEVEREGAYAYLADFFSASCAIWVPTLMHAPTYVQGGLACRVVI